MIQSLRIMTDILGQTTFVTLYQASESIYSQFDKVLLLDKGRQVYFGSPGEARKYFEGIGYGPLPRQSTADYLTGCTGACLLFYPFTLAHTHTHGTATDPHERQFAPGHTSLNTPSTPSTLEQAFSTSPIARSITHSLSEYKRLMETEKSDQEAFRAAVATDKRRGVSEKSPYTLSFWGQV
jgi:ABC-type multidrug transport system, ATPase component